MICWTSSEIFAIAMQSILQDSCTEWELLAIIRWGCLFGIISSFWSRLVLNWRCEWTWFGCTDFLLHTLMCCWLRDRHLMIWYRRKDWWHCYPMSLNREGDILQSRCCSCNWKNDSGCVGGSLEEFCYVDRWIFGSVYILQWWYNRQCDFKDGKDICYWMIEIIIWYDVW